MFFFFKVAYSQDEYLMYSAFINLERILQPKSVTYFVQLGPSYLTELSPGTEKVDVKITLNDFIDIFLAYGATKQSLGLSKGKCNFEVKTFLFPFSFFFCNPFPF